MSKEGKEIFCRISDLKKWLSVKIKSMDSDSFPETVIFHELNSFSSDMYEISINIKSNDFFIDKKGFKWIKVSNAQ